MAPREDPPPRHFDLFAPVVSDLPIRDQRETMERPFFSLSDSPFWKGGRVGLTGVEGLW